MSDPFMEMMAAANQSRMLNLVPVGGEELKYVREEMQPIADLRPGDKVRWKDEKHIVCRFPMLGEVCEVFAVYPNGEGRRALDREAGAPQDRDDFSILFKNGNGKYAEYLFDSRRFERI
jgi:hypothetical protein